MQTPHSNNAAEGPILLFLRELQSVSDCEVTPSGSSIHDWMKFADLKAMELQSRLDHTKNMALRLTLISIVCLATLAVLLHTPAPQVLCPFAVFLMILFNDRQRNSGDVFRFTSLRLTAETLRIVQAVKHKPDQLAMVLASRRLSTHAVVDLSDKACDACEVLLGQKCLGDIEMPVEESWSHWVNEQKSYYVRASSRERDRGQFARKLFNTAFLFVGFTGIAAGILSLISPAATSWDVFKIWMAAASALGSSGLAYVNYVRDKKAFDQSFDYKHMALVFESGGLDVESVLVNESINEHVRWALRMAGHFEHSPPRKAAL